ncbi:hypothetical protein BT69DRAFT_419949 [Atractiella rhizophila]|nr:hypothetical protein BT69DRAFT_419949 [Atractiella rhizophila]
MPLLTPTYTTVASVPTRMAVLWLVCAFRHSDGLNTRSSTELHIAIVQEEISLVLHQLQDTLTITFMDRVNGLDTIKDQNWWRTIRIGSLSSGRWTTSTAPIDAAGLSRSRRYPSMA